MLDDPYKILKLEFPGIKDVISEYSADGLIGNYIKKLDKALSIDSIDEVLYCLEHIKKWYDENIEDIWDDDYVINKDDHNDAKELIELLYEKLKSYDFSQIKESNKQHNVGGDKVFVVHGHDNEAKNEVARFIEKLGIDVTILHEQPDYGKTLIEKLEIYLSEAAYAIILYTECDLGRDKNADQSEEHFRARQNVVFEHGLFTAALRRKNVCALVKGDVEKPSDMDGILYVTMDADGAWKFKLAQNMKAAGMPIDLNRLMD